jgi:hypothetical protein
MPMDTKPDIQRSFCQELFADEATEQTQNYAARAYF